MCKFASGCEFAPPFQVVQFQRSKLAPGEHLPWCANCAHERNLLSRMYNLILDFDKLPILSLRHCMKISYINRPLIKLKIMASVNTAVSDIPDCKVEQLEFLVHWLRFARFFIRTMYHLHLSHRKQSLPEPWRRARVQVIRCTQLVKSYTLHDNRVPPFTIHDIRVFQKMSNESSVYNFKRNVQVEQ